MERTSAANIYNIELTYVPKPPHASKSIPHSSSHSSSHSSFGYNKKRKSIDKIGRNKKRRTKKHSNGSLNYIANKYKAQNRSNKLLSMEGVENTKEWKKVAKCSNYFEITNGKKTTKLCKSRYCENCNRIRASKNSAKYENDLKDCKAFLTLTRQDVSINDYDNFTKARSKFWRNLNDKLSRLEKKNNGIVRKYLRCEEITSNEFDKLHTHYHIAVSNHQTAQFMLEEWIKFNNEYGTEYKGKYAISLKGQDIRDYNQNSKELFKYVTKLDDDINLRMFDKIGTKLYRKRTIQAIGFTKTKSEEIEVKEEQAPTTTAELKEALSKASVPNGRYVWNRGLKDYINIDTGELAKYLIYEEQRKILKMYKLTLIENLN